MANAQETVHNLNVSLQENNANNFPTLCITNHSQGRWATKDGQVANLLFGYEGKIISVNEDTVPEECHMSNVLLLRNDGWQYKPEQ